VATLDVSLRFGLAALAAAAVLLGARTAYA
jgi:hypothetical protein